MCASRGIDSDRLQIETAAGSFAALARGRPEGTTVLCLHGFPDHAPSFLPLLERLAAAGWRAVAPWMRGYAPSTLAGPFDLERLAADVLALADALSAGRPVALVGHDWGALASYAALGRAAPGRLRAAVTLAVPHPAALVANLARHPAQLGRSAYIAFFQLGGLADRAVAWRRFALARWLWRRWSPGGGALAAARLDELARTLAASMPAPLEYYRATFWPPGAGLARLRALGARPIPAATLHLHGAQDGCIAPGLGEGQARFFAGPFRSEVVPGVGHFLHVERPDEIAARILGWLGAPDAA